MRLDYRSTVTACYIGNFTQAIVTNLTPLLFIPLRAQFGLTFGQLGFLSLLNFVVQVAVDIAFSKAVDKHGFRPFITTAHLLCVLGFAIFGLTPFLLPGNEFIGFVIGTTIFAGAGGLLELLLSPIVDAIPTDAKDKALAMLHSFYAWGVIAMVLPTTLALSFGVNWQWIVLLWAVVPLCNFFLFTKVPLARKLPQEQQLPMGGLLKKSVFWLAFMAILVGGSSEVIVSQWASSFLEKGLGLPKIWGDLIGVCGFAAMLGLGRMLYGKLGHRINLHLVLILGSAGAFCCYLVISLVPIPAVCVLACVLCGLCVSLMWPGTLSVATNALPTAGAGMFALLAAGGDIGCSLGPWVTGLVTDVSITDGFIFGSFTVEQTALRIGLLSGIFFPLITGVLHMILARRMQEKPTSDTAVTQESAR